LSGGPKCWPGGKSPRPERMWPKAIRRGNTNQCSRIVSARRRRSSSVTSA
jgi:hypothetical protein